MQKHLFGRFETPFGLFLLGTGPKGICWFALACDEGHTKRIMQRFPEARYEEGSNIIREAGEQLLSRWRAGENSFSALDLRGSTFQLKVWQRLLDIPRGQTLSYSHIANDIGKPGAARAVGNAVAANLVCLAVPCHRVLPQDGSIGNYSSGGPAVKRRILEEEGAL